ncbi:MAG: Rpn family recombination-promoting nuclease/putative transposase, partial [Bacteroidales bacterium]|nr:Rpn family recombination-promoting nuclease/putative transposase [Bacteroidales bacterium]
MAIVSKNSNIYSPYIYVDLLTDYGFKLAFGNREILLHFLNSLFEKDGIVFKSVRYLNKEQTQMHKSGRTIFYDVLCKIDGGADVIIEMQHQSQDTFGDRALYYMSNSIVKQGSNKNDWHYKMCPVYGIFIMNFHMIGDNIPENVVNEVSVHYGSYKGYFTN